MPPAERAPNAEQIAYWNGPGGQRWLEHRQRQDELLAPVLGRLLDAAQPAPGERVLDVGCGCGTSTLALALRVGAGGQALGVDVSAPMIGYAQAHRPPQSSAQFLLADAGAHPFAPASFDLLFSRFGVMFFEQPQASFRHLAGALRPGARLAFACWRTPRENPWMMLPLQAAYRHVPRMPEVAPEDPGPFSFADRDRVAAILAAGGFTRLRFTAVDLALDLALGRGLDSALDAALAIGPASRALEGQPADLQAAARAEIRRALAPHQAGDTVPLGAALWIVQAELDQA